MENEFNKSYRFLMLDELEEYKDCIDGLTKYINDHSDVRHALNNRAVAYSEIGEAELAIADLKTAIENYEPDYVPLHNLADIYLKQKNYNKAIEYYTKAIECTPVEMAHYILRAHAYMEAEDWANAILDFDQAIMLDPEWKQTYKDRAKAKQRAGDIDGAAKDREIAKRL